MLLLVFFLSRVADSRDKVLKLAPLGQLLSKSNLNLPNETPLGCLLFDEASRFPLVAEFERVAALIRAIFTSRCLTVPADPLLLALPGYEAAVFPTCSSSSISYLAAPHCAQ